VNINFLKSIAILVFFSLTGCGDLPVTRTTDFSIVPIKTGKLKNEDITIRALDGSFELIGGETFETPFSLHDWPGTGCNGLDASTADELVNQSQIALGCKSRGVEILQEDQKALYGILFFSSVIPSSSGPASRSYLIEITDSALNRARDGGISVLFEKANFVDSASNGMTETRDWYTWILWISSTPPR